MQLTIRNATRNTTLVALVLFGFITIAAEERTVKRVLKTASGVIELSIVDSTGASSYISTGDPDRVVVEARITGFLPGRGRQQALRRVEEIARNPPIKQDGNSIRIGELPWRVRRDVSISYDIEVPTNTNVYVNGPETVRVQNLVGNLHVDNATTYASEILGNVKLTNAQTVRVFGVSGNLHVTGGKVIASDIQGNALIKRAEYVAIDDVSGKVTVTDRSNVIDLNEVLVDIGTFGL